MKTKLFLASILLALMAAIMGLQLSQVESVAASTISGGGPITSPISYFFISGKVRYAFQNGLIKPAANVLITATNTQTSSKSATLTNTYGDYKILVPAGVYSVKARDNKQSVFRPSEILVNVLNGNASNINFGAIIRLPY